MDFETPQIMKCKLLTNWELIGVGYWTSTLNIHDILHFGLKPLDLEILIVLSRKPCKE